MTPATVFLASLSLMLWMGWTADAWPEHTAPHPWGGRHVLRCVGLGLLCALGAAVWTLVLFKESP